MEIDPPPEQQDPAEDEDDEEMIDVSEYEPGIMSEAEFESAQKYNNRYLSLTFL